MSRSQSSRQPGPIGITSSGRVPGPTGARDLEQETVMPLDASDLVRSYLPDVLPLLEQEQLGKIQKILNAAVYNPEILAEANQYYEKSKTYYGQIVVVDEKMSRRGDRVMKRYVYITESDMRFKLNAEDLLTDDAFTPRSTNPDEIKFLEKMRKSLIEKGVWLRISQQRSRDPDHHSRWRWDPQKFEAWLSLGPEGEAFKTERGKLDRKALMNSDLGYRYLDDVIQGPVNRTLRIQFDQLREEIEDLADEYEYHRKVRAGAAPGVTYLSDLFGGAEFPSDEIWTRPNELHTQAYSQFADGEVQAAQVMLIVAAVMTQNAATLLSVYVEDTTNGAERVVTVLEVIETCAAVADVVAGMFLVFRFVQGFAVLSSEKFTVDVILKKGIELIKSGIGKDNLPSIRNVSRLSPSAAKRMVINSAKNPRSGLGMGKYF